MLAVATAACGEDAPPIRPEPTPPVAAPEPAPTVEAVRVEDVLPPEPSTHEITVLTVPADAEAALEDDVEVGTVSFDDEAGIYRASAPTFALPDEAARALLAQEIERSVGTNPDPNDVVDTRCDATLANHRMVSMTCSSIGSGGRTGFDRVFFGLSYLIDGGSVRAVQIADAIGPGEPVSDIAFRACRARAEEGGDTEAFACDDSIAVAFGARGLAVRGHSEGGEDVVTEIPYDGPDLRDRLLADGPLGALWPEAARRTVSVSADHVFAAHPWAQWTFGPTRSLELAALASLTVLQRDHFTPAYVAAVDGGFRSVVRANVETVAAFNEAQVRARAVAGEPITRLASDVPALSVDWMTTTEELALRSGPGTDGPMLRTLPLGTGLSAIEGTVEGHTSERGGRGSWMRVVVAEGISGWVAARYLRSGTCILPNLPPTFWPEAARAWVGTTLFGEAVGHHFAIIDVPNRSWVLDAASCTFESARVIEIEGRIDTIQWLSGGRSEGDLLLVVSRPLAPGEPGFDGTTRWSLVAPGAATAGWSTTARGDASVPENERASMRSRARVGRTTWDIVVQPVGEPARRARWDGSAFVESTGS